MDAQMKRGFIEACILTSVSKHESYGYQIIREIPPVLELTESTLYPVLKRLEAAHLVSVRSAEHNGRLRKYYRATSKGNDRLKEFYAERIEVLGVYNYIKEAIRD